MASVSRVSVIAWHSQYLAEIVLQQATAHCGAARMAPLVAGDPGMQLGVGGVRQHGAEQHAGVPDAEFGIGADDGKAVDDELGHGNSLASSTNPPLLRPCRCQPAHLKQ